MYGSQLRAEDRYGNWYQGCVNISEQWLSISDQSLRKLLKCAIILATSSFSTTVRSEKRMMFPAGLFITSVILGTVSAFPNGAPDIACGEMIPGHLPTGTSGTNPFMFNVSATTYKSGDEISGYLYSAENLDFRGFLIRVGSQNSIPSKEEGVGEFISLDSSIQKHVCSKTGITHINNNDKKMVKFVWKAPDSASGDLYFRATVVQKFFPSRYWLGAFSQRIAPA